MSKRFNWKGGTGAVLFVLLATGSLINSALAANTHSIDLESGSSQYLSISDGSQTGLDLSNALTFEAWVKFESLPSTSTYRSILSKREGSSNNRAYDFYLLNDSGTYKLGLMITSHGNNVDSLSYANWTPSVDTWYHVAVTWDNSGQLTTLYVNGSSIGTTDTSADSLTTLYNSAASFVIGASEAGTGNYFDGLIDDVRIWSITRTETEIADDMSRELFGNESGLVSYWKLNSSLVDHAGQNTLTNNGSAAHSTDTPFVGFDELLKVRKSSNESETNSAVLQNDDELKLSLAANKTYIIDGVIFASSTSATPDLTISFFGQSGSDVRVGYTNDVNELVLFSGDESNRIQLPADTPTSIHIKGTVTTGSSSGDLQLKWAQATSNGNATTVMEGSYLRAEEI